jgi:hypothetical protein
MQPFRIEPQVGPEAYQTYSLRSNPTTHYRSATCSEVGCAGYQNGFKTIVPSDSPQAQYIRAKSGRQFTEQPAGPGLAEFLFPAGQTCFRATEHRVSLEREPFYLILGGDHRGNPRGTSPRKVGAEQWVDEFATHQQTIADAIKEG